MKKDPGNTFSSAQSVVLGSQARVFSDSVSAKDKFDVYRFKLTSSSNLKGVLGGLKAKADFALYNGAGKLIRRSSASFVGKNLKASLSAGTYYIAVAHLAGSTSYKLNLTAVSQVTTPPPPPASPTIDVTGNRLSAFPTAFSGLSISSAARNFDLDYSINNLGNSDTQEFLVSFYLSNNNFISTSDQLLGTYRISNLPAFSTTPTYRANLNLPPASDSWWVSNPGEGASFGLIRTYYVGMVIDPANGIVETDENNNSNVGSSIDYTSITISRPTG